MPTHPIFALLKHNSYFPVTCWSKYFDEIKYEDQFFFFPLGQIVLFNAMRGINKV